MNKAVKLSDTEIIDRFIIYPESDGKPMADNTVQYRYIVMIKEGLEILFYENPNVFIAADLLWYPAKGRPDICAAPDVMVAFGRPKGERRSYKQWEEGNTAPQVAFEILSPNNTFLEMDDKREFYEEFGVEEYYLYDPDRRTLKAWMRENDSFQPALFETEWKSPLLGVTLKLESDGRLNVFHPDGSRFLTPVEMETKARQERERADHERTRADHERGRADHERERADHERERAERAETEVREASNRAEQMAAKLRELGIDPEHLQIQ